MQQPFLLHLYLQVIAIAKELGQRAVGFELNPWLVAYSRLQAWWSGFSHLTEFYVKDMWKVPQMSACTPTDGSMFDAQHTTGLQLTN